MIRLKLLLILFFLSLRIYAQTEPATELQQKSYPRVIAEYIKSISEISDLKYDTLFIGKHEEFPDIYLPLIIQGKKIILLDSQKPGTGVEKRESFILVNVIELGLTKENAKFMLITFFKGYHPQHNMYIELKFNPVSNTYEKNGEAKLEQAYDK